MPKLSDYIPEKNYFALHVSTSGAGKSCASASFAREGEKAYFFDCDHRIAGILNHPCSSDWIPHIEYDQPPKSPEGLEFIMKKLESWQGNKCPFHTVVVSTVTSFDDISMAYANKYAGNPADQLGRYGMPGMRHFGVEGAALEELVGMLKGLKRRVIVEAHWTTKYTSDAPGKPKIIPSGKQIMLRDKLAEWLPVEFNDVFFFDKISATTWNKETLSNVEIVKFEIVTNNELARTTIPGLPSRIDWSGKNFRNLLFGEQNNG
jgi:hypothetical protein